MDENLQMPTTGEIMAERGEFTANGYTFTVEPIYCDEEGEFEQDLPRFEGHFFRLYPRDKDGNAKPDVTDDELTRYCLILFQMHDAQENEEQRHDKVKKWFCKHVFRNHRYYADNPEVEGFIKWVERKVRYNGKRIKFYDLERKFKLTKAEIIKLLGYLEAISGF